jgi:hypothetical protein
MVLVSVNADLNLSVEVLTTSRDVCDFVLSFILILVLTVKFTNCNEILIYTFRIYCQLIS